MAIALQEQKPRTLASFYRANGLTTTEMPQIKDTSPIPHSPSLPKFLAQNRRTGLREKLDNVCITTTILAEMSLLTVKAFFTSRKALITPIPPPQAEYHSFEYDDPRSASSSPPSKSPLRTPEEIKQAAVIHYQTLHPEDTRNPEEIRHELFPQSPRRLLSGQLLSIIDSPWQHFTPETKVLATDIKQDLQHLLNIPIIFFDGQTVEDVIKKVHKSIARRRKFFPESLRQEQPPQNEKLYGIPVCYTPPPDKDHPQWLKTFLLQKVHWWDTIPYSFPEHAEPQ